MSDDLPEGEFYVVSNYGYGDGACYGPFTAYEALEKYYQTYGTTIEKQLKTIHPWNPAIKYTLIGLFNGALKPKGFGSTPTHYITDNDESDNFADFMSS